MQSLLYFKKGSETILDSLDPLFVGESVSPLEFSFEPAHLPRLKFASRRSGCKSRPRRIIHDFDAWQWVCRQCHGGFAGQRFFLGRRANLRRSLINFCSAALVTKSEFWSSAITIAVCLSAGLSSRDPLHTSLGKNFVDPFAE
jgi:hypothetical protein